MPRTGFLPKQSELTYGTTIGIFRRADRPALPVFGNQAAPCHVGGRIPDLAGLRLRLFLFQDIRRYGAEYLLCSHQRLWLPAMEQKQSMRKV